MPERKLSANFSPVENIRKF